MLYFKYTSYKDLCDVYIFMRKYKNTNVKLILLTLIIMLNDKIEGGLKYEKDSCIVFVVQEKLRKCHMSWNQWYYRQSVIGAQECTSEGA